MAVNKRAAEGRREKREERGEKREEIGERREKEEGLKVRCLRRRGRPVAWH